LEHRVPAGEVLPRREDLPAVRGDGGDPADGHLAHAGGRIRREAWVCGRSGGGGREGGSRGVGPGVPLPEPASNRGARALASPAHKFLEGYPRSYASLIAGISRPLASLPAMRKTYLAAVFAAAFFVLLVPAGAGAADLESELSDKEAKLSKVRDRAGVLTSTISSYRDRIERLTREVAVLRTEEAAVRERLEAKQGELDSAVAELDVAKKHLAVVRARLKRSLVALRERL